ncbi:hypothetical protein VCRA2116O29_50029 [Vibrio crassostreae]|nr:hypothetical protein VCRA2116O29_50029 [Vibrio crassostreae]CAK3765510.1 hypothetical protein VCRA2123O74_20079 [Vibrio crassostreae]
MSSSHDDKGSKKIGKRQFVKTNYTIHQWYVNESLRFVAFFHIHS